MNDPQNKEYVDLPHTHIIQVDNHSFLESLIDMIPLALEKFQDAGTIGGYSLENVVDIEMEDENIYCIMFKTDKDIEDIIDYEDEVSYKDIDSVEAERITKEIEKKMLNYAKELQFEKAALLRDQLNKIKENYS